MLALERWLSGRKRQIANLLKVLIPSEGSNPSLSVLCNPCESKISTLGQLFNLEAAPNPSSYLLRGFNKPINTVNQFQSLSTT